ncbi:MAG TPA: acetolactate synthase large subunit [Streptosporangiaceae bacterium]
MPAVPAPSQAAGQLIGAQGLISSLVAAGVDVCFANPGTSEMHFVHSLDSVPQMRGVLALFEGVATGAADGYARITGRPAAVLLHLGPGLGNGLANLHNARRAHSPVLCIVGAHATSHERYDAPLQSDIEAVARSVSGWVGKPGSTRSLSHEAMRAVEATRLDGGQVATLVLPADVSWGAGGVVAPARPVPQPDPVDAGAVHAVAGILQGGSASLLLLGSRALTERGLRAAGRIAAATRVRLLAEAHPARMEGGAGLPWVQRVPYRAEQAEERLAGTQDLILAGARAPVTFFAYPDRDGDLVPDGCTVTVLSDHAQDTEAALDQLAELVGAPASAALAPAAAAAGSDGSPSGPLSVGSLAAVIAATLPEHAIVVDEANTSGIALPGALAAAPRHTVLTLTGGAIGQGMPVATGAAVAAPDRRVLCVDADGSALYTIQSLWTQAREHLNVTTVVVNNAAYAVLRLELARVGAGQAGEHAASMLSLASPTPDFTQVSRGLGVPASRVTTAEELHRALRYGYAADGPYLIEAIVPPLI